MPQNHTNNATGTPKLHKRMAAAKKNRLRRYAALAALAMTLICMLLAFLLEGGVSEFLFLAGVLMHSVAIFFFAMKGGA